MTPIDRLAAISTEIASKTNHLDNIFAERIAVRNLPEPIAGTPTLLTLADIKPKKFKIVAQGDSWFDYPTSWDLIDWLSNAYEHDIDNLGVAGSTLNDIVYGAVPHNWLGIPQTHDISRSAELIHRIEQKKPDAVFISGGGNDIAGDEFFSFVNNAFSKLENPNTKVLEGVVDNTLAKCYRDIIELIQEKAKQMGMKIPIFLHGYDYPWPDGRGFSMFNIVGPWFHQVFNQKNFPYTGHNQIQLKARYDIVKAFMDAFNSMQIKLTQEYADVHHVDLRGTLAFTTDWANELHPTKEGFGKCAEKVNLMLHKVLG